MVDACIVGAVRTPVGRGPRGAVRYTRPDELAAIAIGEALRRVPALDASEIEDVILGCAMPEAEQGLNVARIASLRAGVPITASAVPVNRFCSSGLQAIAYAADRIILGVAPPRVARRTEQISTAPRGGLSTCPRSTGGRGGIPGARRWPRPGRRSPPAARSPPATRRRPAMARPPSSS